MHVPPFSLLYFYQWDQYSPIWTECESINDLLYDYKLVWTLCLFDYKSKQSQEETTAVQCPRKHTMWDNSDWLTFSQARIWLAAKFTSEINQKTQISARLLCSEDAKVWVHPRHTNSCQWIYIQRVFTLLLRNYLNFWQWGRTSVSLNFRS